MFTSLLKDMTEDTDGHLELNMQRAKSGRILSSGASVPVGLNFTGVFSLLAQIHPQNFSLSKCFTVNQPSTDRVFRSVKY